MTESSKHAGDESQDQKHVAATTPVTPWEPVQLDLFEPWAGDGGWIQDTPHETRPSRDFVLPAAPALASQKRPLSSSQVSTESTSVELPKVDSSD